MEDRTVRMGEEIERKGLRIVRLEIFFFQAKKSELVSDADSLEHLDVKQFYENFREKIRLTNPSIEENVELFLKSKYFCLLKSGEKFLILFLLLSF